MKIIELESHAHGYIWNWKRVTFETLPSELHPQSETKEEKLT